MNLVGAKNKERIGEKAFKSNDSSFQRILHGPCENPNGLHERYTNRSEILVVAVIWGKFVGLFSSSFGSEKWVFSLKFWSMKKISRTL